jgi:hypothetical protein
MRLPKITSRDLVLMAAITRDLEHSRNAALPIPAILPTEAALLLLLLFDQHSCSCSSISTARPTYTAASLRSSSRV